MMVRIFRKGGEAVGNLNSFLADEITLSVVNGSPVRDGWLREIKDDNGSVKLYRYAAGKIPYYYRRSEDISRDFYEEMDCISAIADMVRKAPTKEPFRCSHFAEILSCIYLQEVLGYKILMRKLTHTTSEDTNVHKMDAMCVDVRVTPYKYIWIETKSSRQHGKVYHRNNIYKKMIESLDSYKLKDARFDFTQICDNLSKADFDSEQQRTIRSDLKNPPGPYLYYHGVAVINYSSFDSDDTDSLLCLNSQTPFDVRILALTDLRAIAVDAYGCIEVLRDSAERGVR